MELRYFRRLLYITPDAILFKAILFFSQREYKFQGCALGIFRGCRSCDYDSGTDLLLEALFRGQEGCVSKLYKPRKTSGFPEATDPTITLLRSSTCYRFSILEEGLGCCYRDGSHLTTLFTIRRRKCYL